MPKIYYLLRLSLSIFFITALNAGADISIDGILDEPEWVKAEIFTDFVTVEPLTGDAAKYATEVRMITNQDGIFVGFKNYQPASVKRINRQFARDSQIEADRNVVSIDFDGTAKAGYDFTVGSANSQQDGIVTPRSYSADWDGTWYSQTSSQGDYWYSEMHIPWTIAAMISSDTGRKNIAVWFSRVVFEESLRFAYPNAFYSRPTFMEDWQPLTVDQVSASTLDWFPYASYASNLQDASGDGADDQFNAGLDFIWRPNSNSQLTGAFNPDFGQVESDDLVVNFSAFETFVTEKRPFFTENQSLFSVNVPNGDRMIYTRRIGAGPAGSSDGLVDIDIAAKLSHFGESTDMGAFAVIEDSANGSLGGDFFSSRLQYKAEGLSLGHSLTYTERPSFDRDAIVHGVDMIWQKDSNTEVRGQVMASDIQQRGNLLNSQVNIDSQDIAGWALWTHAPSDEWQYAGFMSHYGDQFDMNDMGYMRRNDFNELFTSIQHDQQQFAADSSVLSTTTVVEIGTTENGAGDRLTLFTEWDHAWTFKSTRKLALEAGARAAGWDDRISRGNGLLRRPAGYWLEARYDSPRGDDLTFQSRINYEYDSLEKGVLSLSVSPQLYLAETLTLSGSLRFKNLQHWMIWDSGNQQLGGYQAQRYSADLRLDWYPSSRQEVRLKFQWIGIDAKLVGDYQLNNLGGLTASDISSSDFGHSDTALQVRYRYQLAPLSDVFLVYSRGGYFNTDNSDLAVVDLLQEGWDSVQVESIVAKVRYRF
jgi:hypothetical protein